MKNTKHIWRMVLLILSVGIVLAVARLVAVPKTFGLFGHYRAENLPEQKSLPVKHNGSEACEACHSAEHETWQKNSHKAIGCENCHAPYVTHIKDDEKFADMEINASAKLCLRCHEKMTSRPSAFPQIDIVEHLTARKLKYDDKVCLKCHHPHDPTPKELEEAHASRDSAKE